jgi:hypothetical protein
MHPAEQNKDESEPLDFNTPEKKLGVVMDF